MTALRRGSRARTMAPMNDDLEAAIQRYFDADLAAGYEERVRGRIPAYDTLHELAADLVAGALSAEARVLVVGAGTGEDAVRCARLGAGVRVTAVEPSGAMSRMAADRIAREGLERQVSLVEGRVTAAPLEPFDAVTAILVMHFIPDDGAKAACLREIARRMKPGALLVTADMVGARDTSPFESMLSAWSRWRARRGADAAELAAYFHRVRHELQIVTEERYRTLLFEAGFSDITRFFGAFAVAGYHARYGGP
jgi:tRNA (cmo5U34)-methyltransferase